MWKRSFQLLNSAWRTKFICKNFMAKNVSFLSGNIDDSRSIFMGSSTGTTTSIFLKNSLVGFSDTKTEVYFPNYTNIVKDIPTLQVKKNAQLLTLLKNNMNHNLYENGNMLVKDKIDNQYWMGNLLKKRRRKMNRQKYKKRRKRDQFKREALKNLRLRKKQRKERARERKQEILSKMVVNTSISRRRTRYLAHKLQPGVMKVMG
ncbi:uncharacterized protein LOC124443576 [Xenia sp. Carnegie-2017]|uniref:uncharacterized protein LOC124443576 n=1 Tax=Xenia sp. Carnegie-2017 TaxID=2897299 RepID=UPI001F050597|nr:uncharacterized protein LOC124443576 [Xenia sp. Carnegie-2017]